MTKIQIIKKYLAKGLQAKAIERRTGIRRGYIHNVTWKTRHPEQFRDSIRKWRRSVPRHRVRAQLRQKPSYGKAQQRNKQRHQRETLKTAKRTHMPWTSRDLDYLMVHGTTLTVHEMAVALGRTHGAVLRKAVRRRILLGHEEKSGLNAQQFKQHATGA